MEGGDEEMEGGGRGEEGGAERLEAHLNSGCASPALAECYRL